MISNWKVQSMRSQVTRWRGIADEFKSNGDDEMYRKSTEVAEQICDLIDEGKGYEDSGNTFIRSMKY